MIAEIIQSEEINLPNDEMEMPINKTWIPLAVLSLVRISGWGQQFT